MSDTTLSYAPATTEDDYPLAGPKSPVLGGLLWGIYLAVSWTWCIGMFLPVLLIRDFGYRAWIIFAVPNIIGAALVGRWLNTRKKAQLFSEDHRTAIRWFSFVTIAFQGYFLDWKVFCPPGDYRDFFGQWVLIAMVIGVITVFYATRRYWYARLWLTVPVLIISLIAGSLIYGDWYRYSFAEMASIMMQMAKSPAVLMWDPPYPEAGLFFKIPLAVVCSLGFLTCPILDTSFHDVAERSSPPARRYAFFIVFPVVFGCSIWLSAAYAGTALPDIRFTSQNFLMLVHWTLQIAATVAFHLRSGNTLRKNLLGFVIAMGVGSIASTHEDWRRLYSSFGSYYSPGELGYRAFLGFYGLIFPAYILLRILPRRPAPMSAVWLTIALALPFFAYGFLTPHITWTLPGVAIVLIATAWQYFTSRASVLIEPPPAPAPVPITR